MKRVYLSYAQQDGEAALYIATQLRARGADVFVDYERLMNQGTFTRRLGNEIRNRDCLLLVQSPDALASPLVQTELRFAHEQHTPVLPVVLRPVRDLGEFAFLLHTRPVDFTAWFMDKRAAAGLAELENRLRQVQEDETLISVKNAAALGEVATLNGHTSWVRAIALSPGGALLASASNDNTVRVWDLYGGSADQPRLMGVLDAHGASVWDVEFSPDGLMLASCGNDNTVRLWDVDGEPYEFARFTDHHEPVYAVAFSPDSRLLASASYDKSVHVRDISRLRQIGREETLIALPHASHVYAVTFSTPSEHHPPLLVSASLDSTIRVWEVNANLRQMARARPTFLIGHTSWINSLVFSPNGALMASTSKDKTIRLWDMARLREAAVLTGHSDEVTGVAFSPDGRLIASTSKDKTIRLWDLASQQTIATLHGHSSWANAVLFSPDGALLVTASGDSTIKFWGVAHGARNGG